MKLRKVAIFTVLSGAMLFATVGAAHAEDEATPTLYSADVCADGSTPTVDDSGNSVCAEDVKVVATSDSACADGSDPIVDMNGTSVCPDGTINYFGGNCFDSEDGTQTACPLGAIRRDATPSTTDIVPISLTVEDPAPTDCAVDGTNADATDTPATNCALMYSTAIADNQKEFKSNTAGANSGNSNVALPLLGIAAVLALSFGVRRLNQ
jgi:hypothetical protein